MVLRVALVGDAGVGDEDVDRTEFLVELGGDLLDGLGVGDVELDALGLDPLVGSRLGGVVDPVDGVGQDDRCAEAAEPLGDCRADAAGSAGHHRRLACERVVRKCVCCHSIFLQ